MKKVAVIGAGAMGLAAAYHALKAGHQVVVYEADKVPGGMAAHFDFGGLSLERYYHFVCKADRPTFELMSELEIADKMRWVPTRMGLYKNGRVHEWGDPIALLKFPGLSPIQKLRYGLMMFMATRRKSAGALEHVSAKRWIKSWCGTKVYDAMWRPLFDLKFYEFADNISAAWLWTRIKRVGTSRKSLFQEELGYIDGGSETLVLALVKAIEKGGGTVRLDTPVSEVLIENGAVKGVRSRDKVEAYRLRDFDDSDAARVEDDPWPAGSREKGLRRNPKHWCRLSDLQAQEVGDAQFLGQCVRFVHEHPGLRRVLPTAPELRTRSSTYRIICRSRVHIGGGTTRT